MELVDDSACRPSGFASPAWRHCRGRLSSRRGFSSVSARRRRAPPRCRSAGSRAIRPPPSPPRTEISPRARAPRRGVPRPGLWGRSFTFQIRVQERLPASNMNRTYVPLVPFVELDDRPVLEAAAAGDEGFDGLLPSERSPPSCLRPRWRHNLPTGGPPVPAPPSPGRCPSRRRRRAGRARRHHRRGCRTCARRTPRGS